MIVYFVTHPDVVIDPDVPVPQWPLSARGRSRMSAATTQPWSANIGAIFASTERKAVDAAEILATARGVAFVTRADLGENDRSATGYLPREQFEMVADMFFATPEASVRGWERAIDAQRRIVAAFDDVVASAVHGGDLAIISHGGVGALLHCALTGRPISRSADQPLGAGGFFLTIDPQRRALLHGWRSIDREPDSGSL